VLRVIFNQHKMLVSGLFLPNQKWKIAKKKFLRQHVF